MNPLILQMLLAELRKRGVPEDALADAIPVNMPTLPPAPFEFMGSEPFQPIPSQFAGMEGTDLGVPSEPTSAASTPIPSPAVKAPSMGASSGAELPYQTFEKFTGNKWSGGASPEVMAMLEEMGIQGQAGSADTNLALQKAMMSRMSMPPTNVEGPADMQNVSPQGLAQFAEDFGGSREVPLPATPVNQGMAGIAPSILNSVRPQPMRKKFLGIF